jgi:hypothetical protein
MVLVSAAAAAAALKASYGERVSWIGETDARMCPLTERKKATAFKRTLN